MAIEQSDQGTDMDRGHELMKQLVCALDDQSAGEVVPKENDAHLGETDVL